MNSNFLKAADRGRSHLKHYALALFLTLASLFGSLIGCIVLLTLVIVIYSLASGLPLEQFEFDNLSCTVLLVCASLVYLLTSFLILFWTLKIHQRHPRTLINTRETIRFKRAIAGCTLWFAIRCFSSALFSIFYPDNYSMGDISNINIIALFLGLALCFSLSIFVFISIAYILQGLNQVVKNQLLLISYLSLLSAFILGSSESSFNPIYFLFGLLNPLFWLFLILKEEGIELNIGWLTATSFYSMFCVRSSLSDVNEVFSQCPALMIAQPAPEMISIPVYIVQIAIFYYLLFVYPSKKIEDVG